MRDGGDDEVGAGQDVVQLVRGVKLDVRQTVLRPRLNADDGHAEFVAQSGGFVSDAPYPVDQCRGLAEVEVRRLAGVLVPDAVALRVLVPRQAAGQRQHEHQDVVGDVVVVDAARIADDERVSDQLGIVVAVERPGVRVLDPGELAGDGQRGRRHPAVDRVGVTDRRERLIVRLGRGYVVLGNGLRQAGGQHPPFVVLRRHEYKLGHVMGPPVSRSGSLPQSDRHP